MSVDSPRIDGYDAVRLLGQGGSADVWLMRDHHGDTYAVKIFRHGCGVSGRAEWKNLRAFQHDHVVPVLECTSDAAGRVALVMPYCEGGTLAETAVGRGGLTSGEACTALAPIAEVLALLHAQGVVHGDLNPKNILLTKDGRPLLADLGCLRTSDSLEPLPWYTDGFAAPEVLDDKPASPASDVYALGAVAWFALFAQAPPPPALRPHLQDALPDVPDELCEVIASALSLTPSARIHVEAFATVLKQAAEPVALPVARPPAGVQGIVTRRRRHDAVREQTHRRQTSAVEKMSKWPFVLAAVCAVVLIAIGAWWPTPGTRRPPQGQAATSVAPAPTHNPPTSRSADNREPRRTVPVVHTPHRAEIAALLACRAQAWNRRSVTSVSRCLAPLSQAYTDDARRLAEASKRHLTYSGIRYSIKSVDRIMAERGEAVARLVVGQSAYTVREKAGSRQVPAEEHHVRLTFSGSPGTWKLASWNVL